MKKIVLVFLFSNSYLIAQENLDISKRIHAHICIEDYRTACDEVREAVLKDPNSIPLIEAYIHATAKLGNEKEMFKAWEHYCNLVENPYKNRELLEVVGWSIIDNGSKSTSPLVRVMALLGAFFGQDARGIRIIQRSLRDYDSMVRDVALQISAQLRDDRLKKEVLSLFRVEQMWNVRLSAIRAIGKMKIKEAIPELMKLIEGNSVYEMRMCALEALSEIQNEVDRSRLEELAKSERIGFRQLACQLIVHFDRIQDLDLIVPLIQDTHSEVRASALYCFGMLRPDEVGGRLVSQIIRPCLDDNNETVAITAAWTMTLYDQRLGQKYFNHWLNHSNQNTRIFASSALKATGKYAHPLLLNAFIETRDHYVKMNLALGLLAQKDSIEDAAHALYQILSNHKERLMWKKLLHFKAIAPSNLRHNPAIPHYPEAADQLVRLEIFNTLAIFNNPHAFDAIKFFLQERDYVVSTVASSLLLVEGDEQAIELVQLLAKDLNPKVRVNSALLLALWGEGDKVAEILSEAYEGADRQLKERILEGFGQIHSPGTIPFLSNKLSEPHPTLRIIAAAALLKSMYN